MGFVFKQIDEDLKDFIAKKFDVFLNSSLFPHCEICFKSKSSLKTTEKKRLHLDGHSFYEFEDGVAIENMNCRVEIFDNFSKMNVYVPQHSKFPREQIAFLMLQAYRYTLTDAGQFQMHSAVVMHNGVGIAFCGVPGAGKSTQAHLWEEHLSAEPLNLDQPIIMFDNYSVLVSGSPWSGKEECYKNIQVPLKAIFFVEKSKNNTVRKLSVAESFSYLFLNNFLLPINDDIDKKHKDAILKLVSNVPVYQLECTISKEAVDVAYSAIFDSEMLL